MKRIILTILLVCLAAGAQGQQSINTDEAKVPSYTLPDPLLTESGKVVKNRRQWEKVRRPELMSLFETEMFGKMPGRPAQMHYKVLSTDTEALEGKATRKGYPPRFYFFIAWSPSIFCPDQALIPVHGVYGSVQNGSSAGSPRARKAVVQ